GPVNGFSFNLKDKLEIKSLLFLNIGIPVSGNISYPSDVDKDVLPVNLSLSLYTEVSVTLRRIQLSLYHEWSHSFNLLLEDSLDTFTPAAASSENLHRIGLKFGINL
ncbi:MAG: hypothetical protein PF518_17980, partial [Spirochaetaceae bacterium]|nr:hypothetical protein [Spirochaetaceae bacterium]